MKNYLELNSTALGVALAIFGFIGWVVGLIWHGGMGQPTMVGMMYRGFSYANPMHAGAVLVLFVVGGYIAGEIIGRLYNWAIGKV